MASEKMNHYNKDFDNDPSRTTNYQASLENLQQEKLRIDQQYQETLQRLQQERVTQERLATERIEQLRQQEGYKVDLVEERINRLTTEKSEHEKHFWGKVDLLKQQMLKEEEIAA